MKPGCGCHECDSMRRSMVTMGRRLDTMRRMHAEARSVAIEMVRWIDACSQRILPGSDADIAAKKARKWARGDGAVSDS